MLDLDWAHLTLKFRFFLEYFKILFFDAKWDYIGFSKIAYNRRGTYVIYSQWRKSLSKHD